MKTPLLYLGFLLTGAMSAHGVVIDIDGAQNEFADYSSLDFGSIWTQSSVTDGDVSLAVQNPAGLQWNIAWADGSYVAGAEINSMQSVLSASFTTSNYIQLRLTNTGDEIDLNSVSVTLWRNGAGAAEFYQFAYDATGDGWSADDLLGSPTQVTNAGTIASSQTISYNGLDLPQGVVDNAGIRLYFWGGTSKNGNTHYTNVAVNYSAIPEPSQYALALGAVAGLALYVRSRKRR